MRVVAGKSSAFSSAGQVTLRVLAIVIGGYAASASLVTAASVALPWAGVARSDAYTLSGMLGFLVYLTLALWAAAERRLVLVVAVLTGLTAGGAVVAILAAMLAGEA